MHFYITLTTQVYCSTETWLNDSIMDNEVISEVFTLYHKDRSNRGGGVLVADKLHSLYSDSLSRSIRDVNKS